MKDYIFAIGLVAVLGVSYYLLYRKDFGPMWVVLGYILGTCTLCAGFLDLAPAAVTFLRCTGGIMLVGHTLVIAAEMRSMK